MEQDADELALLFLLRIAKMHLSCVDKNAFPLIQQDHFTIDIVLHLPGQNENQLDIVMPMAFCGKLGIQRKTAFSDIDRIIRPVIAHSFGTVNFDAGICHMYTFEILLYSFGL